MKKLVLAFLVGSMISISAFACPGTDIDSGGSTIYGGSCYGVSTAGPVTIGREML